ncbi:DUF5996 family protein [Mobilicoccus massiliensis]|uniref:DUF5996 family protein n=1 Tax=Mobilicoccus massiliensis TaxID=1522310 RepID=UPI0006944918|nr:DUF5996 family protein [Mobilicoccus massiliensis]
MSGSASHGSIRAATSSSRFANERSNSRRPQNVFEAHRAGFGGKASPVQLFWGSMDLSATRFSGRPAPAWEGGAPPNCPEWVMAEAENEENAAVGFWPGGSAEGSFYAYAVPQPDGYTDADLSPATFDESLGEWILPYETVRTADDPDAMLLSFLDRAYALAADNGVWNRQALDLDPHRLDAHVSGPASYVWPGRS